MRDATGRSYPTNLLNAPRDRRVLRGAFLAARASSPRGCAALGAPASVLRLRTAGQGEGVREAADA